MSRNANKDITNKGGNKNAAKNATNSNQNGGQGDGKKGGTQQRPVGQGDGKNGGTPQRPVGQGDGKNGGTPQSNQNGPVGQGGGKKGGTPPSSPNDMAGHGDGKKESGLEPPSSSNQNGPVGQGDGKKGGTPPSNQNRPVGHGDGKNGGTPQSNQNGPLGQGDGKKGGTQPSNQNGPLGQGDGKKGGTQQSKQNGGQWDGKKGGTPPSNQNGGQGDGKKGGTQQSSPNDMAGHEDGKKESGLEPPSSSEADVSIVSFVEELLDVLYNLLENNIQDYSAIHLPSLAFLTMIEGALEEKVKTIHDKAIEMAELCIDRNREADYTAQLLKTLSEFPQTYDKTLVEKMLCDPPKLFLHADEDPDKLKDPKSQGKTEKNLQIMNMKELPKAVSRIIREMEEKQRSTEKVKNLTQELDNLRDQTHQLEDEVKTLRFRLSELSSAKLTHDNPAIPDLSDPDRPTKLAEKYSSLYDNQWIDAFAELTKSNPTASEKVLTEQLLNILTDGFNFCKDARQDQVTKLEQLMLDPAQSTKSSQDNYIQVNEIFTKHLRDAAKASSNVASENIFKAFVSNTKMNKKYGHLMKLCGAYIEDCVRLCWLMQVQSPPVCIDLGIKEGKTFLKDTYREYTSSGKEIAFVVWPALFLHEKGPLLMKGVAQGK